MWKDLARASLLVWLAACASADRPTGKVLDDGGDGTRDASTPDNPVDFAGLDLTGLDFAGADFTPPSDMAHLVTGVETGGTFNPITSPSDLALTTVDNGQPVLTLHNDAPTIAWISGTDARVATYDGSAWHLVGSPLNGNPGNTASAVQIASRAGKLVVGFVEKSTTGSNSAIYVYSWNGTAWIPVGTPVQMNLTFLGYLTLALSSSGQPYVSWTAQVSNTGTGPSHVYVSRYDGASWSAYGGDFGAESATSSALASKIAVDASNNLFVTWQESFVHCYANNGTWSPVGTGKMWGGIGSGSFEQEITLDSTGHPIVAWMEYDGSASSIYMQRWSGTAWATVVTPALSATAGFTNSQLSSLTVDGLDAPIVTWVEDSGAPAASTVFVRRISGGTAGVVGQALQVTATFRYLSSPQIAVDSHDIVWLVFQAQQVSDMKYRLFAYRYTPPA